MKVWFGGLLQEMLFAFKGLQLDHWQAVTAVTILRREDLDSSIQQGNKHSAGKQANKQRNEHSAGARASLLTPLFEESKAFLAGAYS